MDKNIDDFTDLLARMDRLETGLGIKIDRFTESEQALAKWRKEMTLEVEELKDLKHSLQKLLPETVHQTLEESANLIIPELLPPLIKGLQEATDAFIKSSLKETQRLKNGINQTISEAQELVSSHKKEMTLRRIGVTLIFCFSSLLTAGGIFYYFPQHQYVSYGLSPSAGEFIVLGEAFSENTR